MLMKIEENSLTKIAVLILQAQGVVCDIGLDINFDEINSENLHCTITETNFK